MPRVSLSKFFYYAFLALLVAVGYRHFLRGFNDYHIYVTAGRKILEGHAELLYDRERLEAGGFYYPYFWGLVFAGYLKLTAGFDKIIFLGIFLLAYAKVLHFSVTRAMRHFDLEAHRYHAVALWVMLLNVVPINDALMNSNIGVLLAALSVLAYEHYERKPALGGFYLALGCAFKFYPLFLLGYFAWKRAGRMIAWSFAFFALFYFGSPVLVEGWERGRQLLADNAYVMGRYGDQIGWNYSSIVFQNFYATALRYLSLAGVSENLAYRPVVGLTLLGIFVMYLPSFLRRPASPAYGEKIFIHTFALVPLVTPISWYNMGVFLAPLLAYHVAAAFRGRAASRWALGVFIALYSLTTQDLVSKPINDALEFYGVPFWGICALLFTLTRELFGVNPVNTDKAEESSLPPARN